MKYFAYCLINFLPLFLFGQTVDPDDNSFKPQPGKYIISGWVKEASDQQKLNYNSQIQIEIDGVSVDFNPNGQIIDGWQKIEGEFDIPQNSIALKVVLNCNSQEECYFDDIRVYPAQGNMKSFVYDPDTKKLMAELDENNYATFYEYDAEGGLVRVKKETEKGVFTIQETRSSTTKK